MQLSGVDFRQNCVISTKWVRASKHSDHFERAYYNSRNIHDVEIPNVLFDAPCEVTQGDIEAQCNMSHSSSAIKVEKIFRCAALSRDRQSHGEDSKRRAGDGANLRHMHESSFAPYSSMVFKRHWRMTWKTSSKAVCRTRGVPNPGDYLVSNKNKDKVAEPNRIRFGKKSAQKWMWAIATKYAPNRNSESPIRFVVQFHVVSCWCAHRHIADAKVFSVGRKKKWKTWHKHGKQYIQPCCWHAVTKLTKVIVRITAGILIIFFSAGTDHGSSRKVDAYRKWMISTYNSINKYL